MLTSSTSAAASLGTAILVLTQGSATLNAHVTTGTIASNTISNFPSGEGIFVGGGSGNGSNNTSSILGATGTPISITGNAINGGTSRMGSNAIRAAFNGQQGVANFDITNNGTVGSPITNIQGQGICVFMGGSVSGTTTINNNFIVANQTLLAGTQGLAVQIDDGPAALGTSAADYNVIITNNSVSAYEGNGIRAIARASLGKMDVTIQNNTVGTPILANRNGIRIDSGAQRVTSPSALQSTAIPVLAAVSTPALVCGSRVPSRPRTISASSVCHPRRRLAPLPRRESIRTTGWC